MDCGISKKFMLVFPGLVPESLPEKVNGAGIGEIREYLRTGGFQAKNHRGHQNTIPD